MNKSPNGLMIDFLQGQKVKDITNPTPEFGWIVISESMDDMQSAYHILVASTLEQLNQNQADVWDTKKCISEESINVSYKGKELQSNTPYYWKVKTWCKVGGESSWSEIMEFTTGTITNEYRTTRYPLQQTIISPSKVIEKAKGHYFIDFGKVAFGYLHLEINNPEKKGKLIVQLAERGDEKGVNKKPGGTIRYHQIKLNIVGGNNILDIHPPKDVRNTKSPAAILLPEKFGVVTPFRYVEIQKCPVELDKSMIHQVSIHYPFNENLSTFESPDEILNDIWDLCKYSMKATSFTGVYVDGDRERIPYEADAYINQLSHYSVDREFTLARYSHEYLLSNPTWPTEWKHHSVMMAWQDYMYTGNIRSLQQNYEILKAKTMEHCAREDGLLNTIDNQKHPERDLVDWPKGERDGFDFKPINTVANAFYFHTLTKIIDIAKALGKDTDVEKYQKRAKTVKSMFNEKLFDYNNGQYLDGEGSKHSSLHANMFPLAFDLVPEEHIKSVSDFVVSKGMACSVYAAQYLLEGLYKAGRADIAYERMTSKELRSWYNMLRVGSTITLEAWDNKFKSNQDWNHAWGAVPGNIIPRYLMGVRPLEPGFKKVLIQPQPAQLRDASATIPTIRGPITVSFRNLPLHSFSLKIDLPVGMTAKIMIPRSGKQSVRLSVGDERIRGEREGDFIIYDGVGSGSHTITYK